MNSVKKNATGNDEQCFICKRTENEVKELLKSKLNPIVKKYNLEIIQITDTLNKVEDDLKSHVDAVLKITEKGNLDIKMDTIRHDRDSFEKLIPHLDELLEIADAYYKKIYHGNPLSAIHDYFMNIKKHMTDKNSTEYFEDLKNFQERVLTSFQSHKPVFGLNAKLFERNNASESPEQTKTEEEYKKMGHSIITLKNLIDVRDSHVNTSDPQLKAIQGLKHNKISRNVFSSDGFFPKIGASAYTGSESYGYGNKRPENIIETQFSIDVCAICYSLVWHTPNVTLKTIPSTDQNSELINY